MKKPVGEKAFFFIKEKNIEAAPRGKLDGLTIATEENQITLPSYALSTLKEILKDWDSKYGRWLSR